MHILNRTRAKFLNGLRATKMDVPAFFVWHRMRNIPYPRRAANFYRQFIRPGDLVFDVGANIGERTKIFLALGAKVVAIDPQPFCLQGLRTLFADNPNVCIVDKALGDRPGTAELSICEDDSEISTLSEKWKQEGRFSGNRWNLRISVDLTTLDALMAEHGRPVFCKIDVEGFERTVLNGLTQPLQHISFEFTREFLDDTRQCIEHLSQVSRAEFNYSRGESLKLTHAVWKSADEIISELKADDEKMFWGDIYARFPSAPN